MIIKILSKLAQEIKIKNTFFFTISSIYKFIQVKIRLWYVDKKKSKVSILNFNI